MKNQNNDEFVPYGPRWESAMTNCTKAFLVQMIKDHCIARDELKAYLVEEYRKCEDSYDQYETGKSVGLKKAINKMNELINL